MDCWRSSPTFHQFATLGIYPDDPAQLTSGDRVLARFSEGPARLCPSFRVSILFSSTRKLPLALCRIGKIFAGKERHENVHQ